MVDGPEVGEVVVFEYDSLGLQLGDYALNALDLKTQRRVLGLGAFGLRDKGDIVEADKSVTARVK